MLEQYALGLTWVSNASKKEFYRDNLGRLGFYHATAKQAAVTSHKEDISKVSLAAILSERFENLLFITDKFELTSKEGLSQYWLCMIERGCVINTGTLLSDHEATESLLSEGRIDAASPMDIDISGDEIIYHEELMKALPYLEYKVKTANKVFTVCIDVDDERVLSHHKFNDIVDTDTLHLQEVLQQSQGVWRKYSVGVIKKPKVKYWVAAVVLGVILLWSGYTYYKKHIDLAAQEAAQMQKMKEMQKVQAENLKRQHDLFIKNIQNKNAAYVLSGFFNKLNTLAYYKHGWKLSGLQFDSDQSKILILTYQRMPYSTMNALIQLKEDLNAKQMDIAKDTNSAALSVIFDYRQDTKSNQVSLKDFKNKTSRFKALSALITALQKNALIYALDKSTLDQAGNNTQNISISSQGITAFKALIEATANNPYLTTQSINMKFETGKMNKWQFEGMMYE